MHRETFLAAIGYTVAHGVVIFAEMMSEGVSKRRHPHDPLTDGF
jgi:hypothetical protein